MQPHSRFLPTMACRTACSCSPRREGAGPGCCASAPRAMKQPWKQKQPDRDRRCSVPLRCWGCKDVQQQPVTVCPTAHPQLPPSRRFSGGWPGQKRDRQQKPRQCLIMNGSVGFIFIYLKGTTKQENHLCLISCPTAKRKPGKSIKTEDIEAESCPEMLQKFCYESSW